LLQDQAFQWWWQWCNNSNNKRQAFVASSKLPHNIPGSNFLPNSKTGEVKMLNWF
jgi:hypothetical protein